MTSQKGAHRMLGVKRGTVTCAIAKHAASGPTPVCHTARAGPGPRTDWERQRSSQHNTCAQSWPPTWRRCYGDVMSMHKVYWENTCGSVSGQLPHQDNSPPYSYWSWWVVLFRGRDPSGELSWWGIILGIVVPVGNGWALYLSGRELSLVHWKVVLKPCGSHGTTSVHVSVKSENNPCLGLMGWF